MDSLAPYQWNILALLVALPIFIGACPFTISGKFKTIEILYFIGFSILWIAGFSLISALISSCTFSELFLGLKNSYPQCGIFGFARIILAGHVFLFVGLLLLPIALLSKSLRNLRRPNKALKLARFTRGTSKKLSLFVRPLA